MHTITSFWQPKHHRNTKKEIPSVADPFAKGSPLSPRQTELSFFGQSPRALRTLWWSLKVLVGWLFWKFVGPFKPVDLFVQSSVHLPVFRHKISKPLTDGFSLSPCPCDSAHDFLFGFGASSSLSSICALAWSFQVGHSVGLFDSRPLSSEAHKSLFSLDLSLALLWVARSLRLMGTMFGKLLSQKCRDLLLNSVY